MYYVNYFTDKSGEDKGLYGESFTEKLASNANYANSVIVSANNEKYQTLAHEIGHILLNNADHRSSLVNLMFGSGTRGDAPPLVAGEVTDSRRLTEGQAQIMQNNQLVSAPRQE